MTQAGRMDRRLLIRDNNETQSGSGAAKPEASTLATVWARFIPVGGDETFRGRQITATVDAVYEIRYKAGVVAQMQAVEGSDVYEIKTVNVHGRKEIMELRCSRVAR